MSVPYSILIDSVHRFLVTDRPPPGTSGFTTCEGRSAYACSDTPTHRPFAFLDADGETISVGGADCVVHGGWERNEIVRLEFDAGWAGSIDITRIPIPVKDWERPKPVWTPPVVPEPEVRSTVLAGSEGWLPQGAKSLLRALSGREDRDDWLVVTTYAKGPLLDAKSGKVATVDVMEPTGDLTEKGRASKRKVGETAKPFVESVRVKATRLDGQEMYAMHWIDSKPDFGVHWGPVDGIESLGWTELAARVKNGA